MLLESINILFSSSKLSATFSSFVLFLLLWLCHSHIAGTPARIQLSFSFNDRLFKTVDARPCKSLPQFKEMLRTVIL